jgi:hypothetical protein
MASRPRLYRQTRNWWEEKDEHRKLRLRDRAAAVAFAFDHNLVARD